MPVCKFFLTKNGCARGDKCYFQHVPLGNQKRPGPVISPLKSTLAWRVPQDNLTGPADQILSGSPDPLAKVSCHFFSIGTCRNGDSCRFLHDATNEEETVPQHITEQARNDHFIQGTG